MEIETVKGKSPSFVWMYLFFVYLLLAIIPVAWCLSYNSPQLRGQLISITPWFLEINFILMVIGFAINFENFKFLFGNIKIRQWYLVAVLLLLGVIMAAFVAPRVHRIFYDENIYLNIGQTMAAQKKAAMCADGVNNFGEYHCNQLEHNKQPYGYPYLISIVYRIFGYSELGGFLLNNFIFGIAIVTAFLLGFLLCNSFAAGIYSALIYALIPENIIWANTTAAEPSAALFTALVVLAGVICVREKNFSSLFLFSVLLPFSVQFRPESMLIVPVVGLIFLLKDRRILTDVRFYMLMALSFALVIPHLVQLHAVSGENWGSPGARMSASYFISNLKVNSLFYLNNIKFPLIFTVFFATGVILRNQIREELIIITWFIFFWGVFLTFYAGSYEFGQDVRFSLVSYMPLSLLAGLGLFKLEAIFSQKNLGKIFKFAALAVIFVSVSGFLPHVRTIGEEACQARADHRFAMEIAEMLPDNSLVLTHNPNMFLLWGKNAAQAAIATNNEQLIDHYFQKFTGGVYFHYNYWCNVDDPREQSFCNNILSKYETTLIIEYKERGYTFGLYKLNKNIKLDF